MGNPKKPNNIKGKGNITPVQVAFIVDRYLSDNNYLNTLSTFRSEASNLVSKFSNQQAPKSLLSLTELLNEYIWLKEEKGMVNQERVELEKDKLRVQNLFKGMQDAINAYNYSENNLLLPASLPVVPLVDLTAGTEAGIYPVHNTSVTMSTPRYGVSHNVTAPSSAPGTNQALQKRREPASVSSNSLTAKRSRKFSNIVQLPTNGCITESTFKDSADQQLLNYGNTFKGSSLLRSSSAKGPSNQAIDLVPSNFSDPRTPPASSSQTNNSSSSIDTCSFATPSKDVNSHQITSTNSTIISSQIIQISPAKQITYCSIKRNQSISISSPAKTSLTASTKRDSVKGRLNFDVSELETISEKQVLDAVSTSEPCIDRNLFDLDMPNFDSLGVNLNLSELLHNFDLYNDDTDFSTQPAEDFPPDMSLTSPHISGGANQVVSDMSKVAEVFSEDSNMPGQDTVTTIQSITKRIKIRSPEKRRMV